MISTTVLYGEKTNIAEYALIHAVNELAAAGAENVRLHVKFQIPETMGKSALYGKIKEAKRAAENLPAALAGVEGACTPFVTLPAVFVTAEAPGREREKEVLRKKRAQDEAFCGQDIVLLGQAGAEGMLRVLEERRDQLEKRFSPAFLRQIESARARLLAAEEAAEIRKMEFSYLSHVGEGGIFKALWDLAVEAGGGMEVDLKKISVLQETIEVCELFGLNPYQLTSAGCLIFTVPDGEAAVQRLSAKGAACAVIGHMTKGHDKIVKNGEDRRCLDRPSADEVWKLYRGRDGEEKSVC